MTPVQSRVRRLVALRSSESSAAAIVATLGVALAAAPAAASVDYGPISHKGLKSAGPASTSLKLSLQVGLKVNQGNIADAVKAASNPASSSYGKYPSLSTFQ